MGRPSWMGILGAAAAGLLLAGCQATAEQGSGAAVQMARDSAAVAPRLTVAQRRVQQTQPHIYLIRGLANVFSRGMDELAAKLAQRGYVATVHEHGEGSAIAAAILRDQRASGGRAQAVIIGHSIGANVVADIVNALAAQGGSVALAVAFDPTVERQIAGGTRRFVNFYQANNGWGMAVTASSRFRGRLDNIDLSRSGELSHFNIEKDPRLHAQVIGWVTQAIGPGRHRPARVAAGAGQVAAR